MKFQDDNDRERKKVDKILQESNNQERLYLTDIYDQDLLELKQLVNNKQKTQLYRQKPYEVAIERLIDDIQESGYHSGMPKTEIANDINQALHGGKYRKLFVERTSDDIIEIRKKKSSKPKPKRKIKKVVKKCKCK